MKDFAGGFSLVQKDQYSARKVVRNEAEWAQVFQAWKTGIILLLWLLIVMGIVSLSSFSSSKFIL